MLFSSSAVQALESPIPSIVQPPSTGHLIEHETGRQFTVLVLDAVAVNRRVLRGTMKASGVRILEAERPSEALAILDREPVDTVVVDLMMPEMSGPEFCQRLKSMRKTQLIPILMITSVQGPEGEIAGISSGADEFLTRPLHPGVVRTRIQAMLRTKAATDSLEEAESILFALANTVESRDKYTGDHCGRLARFSMALGAAIGLPHSDLLALYRGGYLHDIGKVCVPDAILFKKGPLDAHEWAIMRDHTVRGEDICRPMKTLAPVLPIIRNHHERFDGSGYPDGLSGESIPLLARIMQVADIYDALTTSRPYKSAFSQDEAFEILNEEVQRGWRDPELIPLFEECMRKTSLWQSLESHAGQSSAETFSLSLDAMRRHLEA